MEILEFNQEDWKIQISPQATVLKPFNVIWKRDKTKNKNKAIGELSYVWLMADYKSDFIDILNKEEKEEAVKESITSLKEDWQPDKKVEDAIEFYKERQKTPSMNLLESALEFTEKLKTFYKDINLDERDPKSGKLIHNVPQLQKGIKELAEQTESLKRLKEVIVKEMEESSVMKGNHDKTIFEDGI